jgi:hypothetical protein
MKQTYVERNFRQATLDVIHAANGIINEYGGQKLTLRQLYYQFVSRNLIPNKDTEYKKLASILNDARLAGLVDWEAIEDRGRVPSRWHHYGSIRDAIGITMRSYRLDRWEGQQNYAELWVEKQALAGVLEPVADQFHATLMVNKGYSSASAMKDAGDRIAREMEGRNGQGIIFYLGDFDPSGEDMVRDVKERVSMFAGFNVYVRKLALTTEQIKQYDPPPNPAKLTDSRAAAFIAKHGGSSWEVDALKPTVLTKIINDAFLDVIDMDLMDEVRAKEKLDKERIHKYLDTL